MFNKRKSGKQSPPISGDGEAVGSEKGRGNYNIPREQWKPIKGKLLFCDPVQRRKKLELPRDIEVLQTPPQSTGNKDWQDIHMQGQAQLIPPSPAIEITQPQAEVPATKPAPNSYAAKRAQFIEDYIDPNNKLALKFTIDRDVKKLADSPDLLGQYRLKQPAPPTAITPKKRKKTYPDQNPYNPLTAETVVAKHGYGLNESMTTRFSRSRKPPKPSGYEDAGYQYHGEPDAPAFATDHAEMKPEADFNGVLPKPARDAALGKVPKDPSRAGLTERRWEISLQPGNNSSENQR